jgi:hypothetical protein
MVTPAGVCQFSVAAEPHQLPPQSGADGDSTEASGTPTSASEIPEAVSEIDLPENDDQRGSYRYRCLFDRGPCDLRSIDLAPITAAVYRLGKWGYR